MSNKRFGRGSRGPACVSRWKGPRLALAASLALAGVLSPHLAASSQTGGGAVGSEQVELVNGREAARGRVLVKFRGEAGAGESAAAAPVQVRQLLVADLSAGGETRAGVLRRIVESPALSSQEKNPAFVYMQYAGYLRRQPDDEGFRFWLRKLDEHGGDFRAAEMVKSFLVSAEYRQRFNF